MEAAGLKTNSNTKGAGEGPPVPEDPFLKPSRIYSYFGVHGGGRGAADSRGPFPQGGSQCGIFGNEMLFARVVNNGRLPAARAFCRYSDDTEGSFVTTAEPGQPCCCHSWWRACVPDTRSPHFRHCDLLLSPPCLLAPATHLPTAFDVFLRAAYFGIR